MKLRNLFQLLGFRGSPRSYGFEVRSFDLPTEGRVEYAQWLHPGETAKRVDQGSVDELRRFLSPGDVAIDIGAHTGDSTIPIALAVGRTGCVIALEPNPYVFPVLAYNATLNRGKTNIVPCPFAAAPSDGSMEFEYSDAGYCNGGRHEGISRWRHGHAFRLPVQGRDLHAHLQRSHPDLVPRIRYIKVDAEGYDLAILESLTALIADRRPYIKAEVYKHATASQREALFAFLVGHSYTVHRVASEREYLGERIVSASGLAAGHFDIFCLPARER